MSAFWLIVGILLPVLAGYSLLALLQGTPRGLFARCAAWGDGGVLGIVGFGALLCLGNGLDAQRLFVHLAPWLALLTALIWLAARRSRRATEPEIVADWGGRWQRLAALGLLVLLLATGGVIASQALTLPTYTWDAWSVWLAKPKAWYHVGSLVPAVSFADWWSVEPGQAITTTAWAYPEAMSRFVLWLLSAHGGWSEAVAHAIWPLLWVLLGLSCFGHLGRLGLAALPALGTSAALLTLPLVASQASLAGYMDLWLAAAVMMACLHWLRWQSHRSWRNGLLALLFAALLPLLKQEGAVWLMCLAAAAVLAWLPRRWGFWLMGLAVAVWLLGQAFGGLPVPVPGLGVIRLGWQQIVIPGVLTYQLAWQPVGIKLFEALFLLPNWALLFYLAPIVVALRWRVLLTHPAPAALGLFLALGGVFLFVLFFLTEASAWVSSFSAVNRLVMHVVPVTVVWLALLWAAPTALRGTGRATAG